MREERGGAWFGYNQVIDTLLFYCTAYDNGNAYKFGDARMGLLGIKK